MNINENPLYMTFYTPFSEQPCKKNDPTNFTLPSCYTKPQTSIKPEIVGKLTDETLIYMFYNHQVEAT